MSSRDRFELVTTDAVLRRVEESVTQAGILAFDTEFVRERTYRARLCLVQIAAGRDIYLIDPLESVDLSRLARAMGDASIQKVVHAGRQDLELFHDLFGVVPRNVFDVQIAAGFVGLGASLPYGRLVEQVTGHVLPKGESYTDWCKRPLTTAQARYAEDDVRYLVRVKEELDERLSQMERRRWAIEEMRSSFEDEEAYGLDLDQVWRKVTGRGALSGRQGAVLKEVARWREETAARRDIPRGWVLKDPTLIEVARRQPKDVGALKSIRGMNAREADRSGRDILGAVERGRRGPALEDEHRPPRAVAARARTVSGLADAVVRSRCERAGVAPELVSTRGELESLLLHIYMHPEKEAGHRLLEGWRRELAGDAVLRLVEGRAAVKVADDPPYVEEVTV